MSYITVDKVSNNPHRVLRCFDCSFVLPHAAAAHDLAVCAENSLLIDLDSKFDLLRLIQVVIPELIVADLQHSLVTFASKILMLT